MLNSENDNRVIDKIHEAVEAAIEQGWSPRRLVKEAEISWKIVLQEGIEESQKDFEQMLKLPVR